MPARKKAAKKDTTAHLGFEAKLWLVAGKRRHTMDAAEYNRVQSRTLVTLRETPLPKLMNGEISRCRTVHALES